MDRAEINKYNKRKEDIMKVTYETVKDTLIVKIVGELDQHSAQFLRKELDKLILLGAKNLLLNLEELDFMDSSGIGVIIGRYKNVLTLGGVTAILNPKSQVEKIIRLSAIDKIIPIYFDLDEALDNVRRNNVG